MVRVLDSLGGCCEAGAADRRYMVRINLPIEVD